MNRLVTIGAYGFDREAFFLRLQAAQVDTFVDVRQRRGVRGAEYAFVNSMQLQRRLAELDIRYVYIQELAPTKEIREIQKRHDLCHGIAKRSREQIGDAFAEEYRQRILSGYLVENFLNMIGPEAKVVALFCVERLPVACHRSLLSEYLRSGLDVPVEDLIP
jgi:uncharacterized protein (DUF488 family)